MKRFSDPFPPTPERFHRQVERTLMSLNETAHAEKHIIPKTTLLAAVLAVVLMLSAVAGVVGNSRLKDALNGNHAGEVAALIGEVHAASGSPVSEAGINLSIDELFWGDDDLFITCSLSVPEGENYLIAMYNPTLNGQRLEYNAMGWVQSKFFDQSENRVLLLGGRHGLQCTELLTFKLDPMFCRQRDNHLHLRVAFMKTAYDFPGTADFGGLFESVEYATLNPDAEWLFQQRDADTNAMLRAIQMARGTDDVLTVEALCGTGYAEMAAEREIDLNFDASSLDQTAFNDVAEHDFDFDGLHLHVDEFRLTHTGVSIRYTITAPTGEEKRLNAYVNACEVLSFCTPEGKPIGMILDESGSGGMQHTAEGRPYFVASLDVSAFIPLADLRQIVLAPVEYPDDEQGNQLPPIYDMERAITLTPISTVGTSF